MAEPGIVYLIGAGPGDPGLLTVRGKECLEEADVVVYDNLANPALLRHAPAEAEIIYVGKQAGQHTLKQEGINALLVAKGQEGHTVARLKGGDPYVFGRGGEEALELRAAGIPFQVIPGVTAGVAAPAYAGIPVTHRTCNSALTFVTGHEDPEKEESAINWGALATGGGTLAFYMGVRNLPRIVSKLVENGRDQETPVALIRRGTLPEQEVVAGTLANIVERVAAAGLTPPAIILVGEVVSLRKDLNWFEQLPLLGKTIVVTRSRTQASDLARDLQRLGARVLLFPTIRVEPPDDPAPLARAVAAVDKFDWILFTSVNAVDSFFSRLDEQGYDTRHLAGNKVCAIGSATAVRLRSQGVVADLVPPRFTSEALFAALNEEVDLRGQRILLPCADIAPPSLSESLSAAGAEVSVVTAYRTLPGQPDQEVFDTFRDGNVDLVTFTSSSTARNFAAIVRDELGELPQGMACISIGPETSKAMLTEGLQVDLEATDHTIRGLVAAALSLLGKG